MTGHDLKKLPDEMGKIKKNHRGTELIKEGGFLPKAPIKIRIQRAKNAPKIPSE